MSSFHDLTTASESANWPHDIWRSRSNTLPLSAWPFRYRVATRGLKIPGVACRPAAVDNQDVTVHVSVFGVGKEQSGHRDLVRVGWPAQGDVIQHSLD